MTQQLAAKNAIDSSSKEKAPMFVDMLKRFNAKERNFLMRYALAHQLSTGFVDDLVAHLQKTGMSEAVGAKAIYFGMDYHLEWIHASLLIATGELKLKDEGSELREHIPTGRIEDVDLLVVLEKLDGRLILVLIEAKGVTPFDTSQLESKATRLAELKTAIAPATEWLAPIMLLMSPKAPSTRTCEKFAEWLSKVGFWPAGAKPSQLWMELKDFFVDIGAKNPPLRIGTCNSDGTKAASLQARNDNAYKHWRVVPRVVVKGEKRKEDS